MDLKATFRTLYVVKPDPLRIFHSMLSKDMHSAGKCDLVLTSHPVTDLLVAGVGLSGCCGVLAHIAGMDQCSMCVRQVSLKYPDLLLHRTSL